MTGVFIREETEMGMDRGHVKADMEIGEMKSIGLAKS